MSRLFRIGAFPCREAPRRLESSTVTVLALLCATMVNSAPANAQPSANTTFTTSTSSTEVLYDSRITQRFDTYLTQIVGRVAGGPTVFDQGYAFAFGSSAVNGGISSAQAALAAFFGVNPYGLSGPTLLSSDQSLASSITGAPLIVSTVTTDVVTIEEAIGPLAMLIGDLGRCVSFGAQTAPNSFVHRVGCNGTGTLFSVVTGTANFNANVNTQFDVYRTITTTDTYLTVERYEIVATAVPSTTVPEPATWALTAVGLAALCWRARRRSA